MNEADTCRKLIIPLLQAAGWDKEPHRLCGQVTFTDGRILVTGQITRCRPGKRAEFILRYRPDQALAVVEAKPVGSSSPRQLHTICRNALQVAIRCGCSCGKSSQLQRMSVLEIRACAERLGTAGHVAK